MIEKTVALAEDESGIVAVSEFDSAPEIVSEENFEQRDFEGVVAPEAVEQGASVAAAAHTMSTLRVFPICFHQLCCCNNTCIPQEKCAPSNYIFQQLWPWMLQEQLG